jgi:putative ubiquitin-RnfH superfamily antitoxin RatB of RatAB toxin-antitoxin module
MACAESPAATGDLHIEVAYSPAPREVDIRALTLPAGATVRQAVDASTLLMAHQLDTTHLRVGVWGRAALWSHVLRDQDRVELYRPLKADPKESRRLRYKKQRPAKKTGR